MNGFFKPKPFISLPNLSTTQDANKGKRNLGANKNL